ncbi:MAG TPA: ABC transporter ATP-binding protein [Microbacteriaceae bacterium]|nr:ABC transporter ATP-binding protein [Microbacteriaceae bacterium]
MTPCHAGPQEEGIRFEGVSVERGEARILDDVTVTLRARRTAIIGRNGSGKSTFVRLVNGLVEPDAGSVAVDGLDSVRERRRLRRMVGFLFTDADSQIVMPTVAEDVAFSLRGRGLDRAEIQRRVTEILARFGLAERAETPAHELSGGQQKLLALCSILVAEPRIVVADEPTALLDAVNTRRITGVLRRLSQRLIVVTHDLGFAAGCDEALLFHESRLVAHGAPADVIAQYERDYC